MGVYFLRGYLAVVDPWGSQAGVARLEISRIKKVSKVCQHFARERDNEGVRYG